MSRSTRRLAVTTTGLAVLATLLVTAPVAHASRTVSQSYAVPSDGKLRLTGHGYGHGHGMSQYGAQGAAKQGLSASQIVAFYYPGTTLGRTTGKIRVLISADTDHDVRVAPTPGLRVREVGGGWSSALSTNSRIASWRLRTVGGRTTLEYDDGSWHAYRPGGHALNGDAEFYRYGALALRVGGTTRNYRGALRLTYGHTVNVLDIDDYVQGVVPREMPASWLPAAVQAQAVAARTYAAFDRAAHRTRSYDTCDTTSCQVYGGLGDEDSRSNAAVAATAGQVLTYQGEPAFTQFGSSSGGWLAAGSKPYLVAKADPYDGFSGNAMHTWTATVTKAAVQRAYPKLGSLKRVLVTRRDGHGAWYGRIEQMVLDGSKSNVTLSGSTFRSRFGLRSQWFTIGSPSSSPAPVPTTTTTTVTPTPITLRWRAIGATRSVVGRPRSREYAIAGGHARRFAKGRMYSKYGSGAHELYGRVLRAYLHRHAAKSRLGFPRTRPVRHRRGVYARFEHGVLFVFKHGRVKVTYYR